MLATTSQLLLFSPCATRGLPHPLSTTTRCSAAQKEEASCSTGWRTDPSEAAGHARRILPCCAGSRQGPGAAAAVDLDAASSSADAAVPIGRVLRARRSLLRHAEGCQRLRQQRQPEAAAAVGYDYAEHTHDGDAEVGAVARNVYDELDREYEETELKIDAKLLPFYTSPMTCSTKCPNCRLLLICFLCTTIFRRSPSSQLEDFPELRRRARRSSTATETTTTTCTQFVSVQDWTWSESPFIKNTWRKGCDASLKDACGEDRG